MKVLGLGNALVDIMTKIDGDDFLQSQGLPKGSMQLVDYEKANSVMQASEGFEKSMAAGGSAANTINGLARLGVETAFIGTVGKDEMGDFFEKDMIKHNTIPQLSKSDTRTGLAVALVTPDAERTFATYLGAAVELSADSLKPEMFKGYDIFHIEGYLVQNYDLIETAINYAKEAGCRVSIDLASFNVVEANLDFLKKMVKNVDIVFANEEEAKAFTGKEPEGALEDIAADVDIAVVKTGKTGSMVKNNGIVYRAGVIKADSIDTTGAGDLYASGFLYGMSKGLSFDKCAEVGAVVAGNVIEVIGAKMDDDRWERIYKMIKDIEK
jgi:sugar/nucleoside kinase (ribokinase family)